MIVQSNCTSNCKGKDIWNKEMEKGFQKFNISKNTEVQNMANDPAPMPDRGKQTK